MRKNAGLTWFDRNSDGQTWDFVVDPWQSHGLADELQCNGCNFAWFHGGIDTE